MTLDAAVGDERHVAGADAAFVERLQLRHAEAGRQSRGAAAARSNPDLDRIDASLGEEPHALGRRDVAGDELDRGERLPERLDRSRHDDGMAVRDVDDDHVDVRLHQFSGALDEIAGGADRGADHQPAVCIARREGEPFLAVDVLGGDQADQRAALVDERQFLDLALDHDLLGDVERQLALAGDQRLDRRHARCDRALRAC